MSGDDVNLEMDDGVSPLYIASEMNCVAIVKVTSLS